MGTAEYDIACGEVQPLSLEELGCELRDLRLSGAGNFGDPELREAVAAVYGVKPSRVIITSGATMGIFLAIAATLGRGEEALLEVPNYEPFYRIARYFGVEVKILDRLFEKGFQVDLEELERRISRNTRALIMTNLHNPSGVATNPEKLQTIQQIAREHGALVIVSEVYREGAFTLTPPPACSVGDNMITVGSLSKIYGLSGLRVGWVIADEKLIPAMHTVENYLIAENPMPSQRLALVAVRKLDALRQRARKILTENFAIVRDWMKTQEDLQWVEPDGGTLCFPKLRHGLDSLEVYRLAQEKYRTLVVPGDFFWAKGHLRIGYGGRPEALRRGLENLSKAIDELKRRKHIYS
ncbi:MAG: aminotransferase class I/II-fold pyridoxal phosphate-dependent enzyme, partial [Planctomycetes bacterium]|nr:aminotransferase class I/II-fold pyridoxal phosphate-dependent enzyme [Planctomycetota bacterium]